jgi:hypothetical protein
MMPLQWPAKVKIIKDTAVSGKHVKAGETSVSVDKADFEALRAYGKIENPEEKGK